MPALLWLVNCMNIQEAENKTCKSHNSLSIMLIVNENLFFILLYQTLNACLKDKQNKSLVFGKRFYRII